MTLNLIGVARARGGSSFDAASPPPIGNVTPNTGAFDALTLIGSPGYLFQPPADAYVSNQVTIREVRNPSNDVWVKEIFRLDSASYGLGVGLGAVSSFLFNIDYAQRFKIGDWAVTEVMDGAFSIVMEDQQIGMVTRPKVPNPHIHQQEWQNAAGTPLSWVNLDGSAFFVGLGSTPLPAANLTGSVADARLSANVVLLTASQVLTNKTLTTPTIASFVNAAHTHQDAAGGGTLDGAAIGAGNIAVARIANALTTPGAIGGTTPATGAFTTLTSSGNVTFGAAGASAARLNVNGAASSIGAIIRASATTPSDFIQFQDSTGAIWGKMEYLSGGSSMRFLLPSGGSDALARFGVTNAAYGGFYFYFDGSGSQHWGSGAAGLVRLSHASSTLTLAKEGSGALNTPTLVLNSLGKQTGALLTLATTTTGAIPLSVTAPTGQTVDLTEWRVNSVVVASVNNAGVGRFAGLSITDASNIALGTTTGTKIGTAGGAAGQKLAFFNSTPITQPLLATGVIATPDDIISVLQALGLVRQS